MDLYIYLFIYLDLCSLYGLGWGGVADVTLLGRFKVERGVMSGDVTFRRMN